MSPCFRGIERKIALPGIRVVSVMPFVSSFSLLITNATPADPVGFSGFGELYMAKRLVNKCCACVSSSVERCISWSARIPICRERKAFATVVHLEIGPVPVDVEERPRIFKVAILMLARWPFCGGALSWAVWSLLFVVRSFRLGGRVSCDAGESCGSGALPDKGPWTSLGVSSVGRRLHPLLTGAGGTGPGLGEP